MDVNITLQFNGNNPGSVDSNMLFDYNPRSHCRKHYQVWKRMDETAKMIARICQFYAIQGP